MTLAHFPGRDPFRMAAWQAPRMRGWLTDDSSLTARIRARCGRFSAGGEPGQGRVLPDELAALGVHHHGDLWQREVLLIADGEPVVFARSLVAGTTIPAAWHLLHGLGGRPLAAVLFDDPRVRRSPLGGPPGCPRFPLASRRAPPASRSAPCGRAVRPFTARACPLLITEIFLPAIRNLAP
jgi:chorismate--pyruvate lyase